MSYTLEQLAELKAARARGVSELQLDGRRVRYRSLKEMDQIISSAEAELSGKAVNRQHYPQFMERP